MRLDERELVVVGVDHVVRDAAPPVIRLANGKFGVARAIGLDQAQLSGGNRHDDIVVLMELAMIAGRRAGGEAPLGHPHPVVFDHHGRYRLDFAHGFLRSGTGLPFDAGDLPQSVARTLT